MPLASTQMVNPRPQGLLLSKACPHRTLTKPLNSNDIIILPYSQSPHLTFDKVISMATANKRFSGGLIKILWFSVSSKL